MATKCSALIVYYVIQCKCALLAWWLYGQNTTVRCHILMLINVFLMPLKINLCLQRLHLFKKSYILNIIIHLFNVIYCCDDDQAELLAAITPVFNITWSFRNQYNADYRCSRNITFFSGFLAFLLKNTLLQRRLCTGFYRGQQINVPPGLWRPSYLWDILII